MEAAEKAFGSTPKPRRKDMNALAETIRTSVRRAADCCGARSPS